MNKICNLLLILFILLLASSITACSKEVPGKFDGLAKCLTEKGAVMYGTTWCGHCNDQKKMFGTGFQFVTFVDCDKNMNECEAAGVKGYPTWKINNLSYEGAQSLYDLAKNSGCVGSLS
jgi:hypothetical protein